ncbi:MAG: hypothetical protein M3362_23685 [Acidobacteriota bacterium]|nr:hypothetical protein [Acidobacteriota bacterium]
MTKEQISSYRSKVIEKFINIEWLLNCIISQHYFSQVNRDFIFEVLYDDQCSFGLKRNIFLKVIGDVDNRKVEDLNRLNKIRNLFAHCDSQDPNMPGKIIDPKNREAQIDFEQLYQEFVRLAPRVVQYLLPLFTGRGGMISES